MCASGKVCQIGCKVNQLIANKKCRYAQNAALLNPH